MSSSQGAGAQGAGAQGAGEQGAGGEPGAAASGGLTLAGRTALVTGSSRGIGLGIARRLRAAGAEVVLHGRDPDRLARTREALAATDDGPGVALHQVLGDLSRAEEVDRVRAEVEQLVGVPDVVVANAGGSPVRPGRLDELDVAGWEATIGSNLTATFLTIRAFVPGMRRRGSGVVLTLSSTAARLASAQSPPAYAAAKAGIEMLTRSLAVQAGPDGVRANCLAPATILTEANSERIPPDVQAELAASYPLGRLGSVEDVAEAALYLVSDASAWVTGQTVDVAGGSAVV